MNKNKKYKNIIFDMGGVLVNWNFREIVYEIFKNKKTMPIQHWEEFYYSDIVRDLERGIISRNQATNLLPEKYNKDHLLYFFNNVHMYLYPLQMGLKIFNKIKKEKYNTYILSNFQKEIFESVKSQYHFLKDFDGAVFSYQVKSMKPEPKIYKTLLDNYALKPKESFFIDDMKINIEGAKKFGIDGIVCKDHNYVFDKLKKLDIF
ncbi:HAD family phosphatase [Candidatus Babeliales bacterium]|nr:HAD family phosphatase [Candidatus Babeliales bacterium]